MRRGVPGGTRPQHRTGRRRRDDVGVPAGECDVPRGVSLRQARVVRGGGLVAAMGVHAALNLTTLTTETLPGSGIAVAHAATVAATAVAARRLGTRARAG